MIFEKLPRLVGMATGPAGLPHTLRDYPAYKAPHNTGGTFIGIDRLQENLYHFLENRSERLEKSRCSCTPRDSDRNKRSSVGTILFRIWTLWMAG